MYLKPKHNWLRGVEITTIDPRQKKLHFLQPFLSSQGDKARKAKKEYENYSAEKQKKREENEETEQAIESDEEKAKEQDMLINFMVASLQQQYDLAFEDGEKKEYPSDFFSLLSPEELEKIWKETVYKYFVEQDPIRIWISIQYGKEMTLAEIAELVVKSKDVEKKI